MRPSFKTLQELRDDLAVSLGFGAMGGAQATQIPILNQFLQQAQSYLWGELHLNFSSRTHEEILGANQEVLDLPDDFSIGALRAVFWLDGDVWRKLYHGLPDEYDLSVREEPRFYGVNTRYDPNNLQIQFYPIPLKPVRIRVDYHAQPHRFTQNGDRATVPDHLLLTLALATAKSHYGQADAQIYFDRFGKEKARIKAQNFDAEGSIRKQYNDPYKRPVRWNSEG